MRTKNKLKNKFVKGKKGQFYLLLVLILTVMISSYIFLRPKPKPPVSDNFNLICENFMNEASMSVNQCIYSDCSSKELVTNLSNFINFYSDYLKYENMSVFVTLFYDRDYFFETFPKEIEAILYKLNSSSEKHLINHYFNTSRNIASFSIRVNGQDYTFHDELLQRSYENFNYSSIILLKALVYSSKNRDIKICYYNTSLV